MRGCYGTRLRLTCSACFQTESGFLAADTSSSDWLTQACKADSTLPQPHSSCGARMLPSAGSKGCHTILPSPRNCWLVANVSSRWYRALDGYRLFSKSKCEIGRGDSLHRASDFTTQASSFRLLPIMLHSLLFSPSWICGTRPSRP